MKRYFLTETLPENLVKGRNSDKLPEDIKHSLHTYNSEKADYMNRPPLIRPLPLEKYSIDKAPVNAVRIDSITKMTPKEIEDRYIPPGTSSTMSTADVISRLPLTAQSRARKLIPFLEKLPDIKELSKELLYKLIYDLTVKNVIRIKSNEDLLHSIYRQLERDSDVDKRLYISKRITTQIASSKPHKIEKSHPKKSRDILSRPAQRRYYSSAASSSTNPWV